MKINDVAVQKNAKKIAFYVYEIERTDSFKINMNLLH